MKHVVATSLLIAASFVSLARAAEVTCDTPVIVKNMYLNLPLKISGNEVKDASRVGLIKLTDVKEDGGTSIGLTGDIRYTALMSTLPVQNDPKVDGFARYDLYFGLGSKDPKGKSFSVKGELSVFSGGETKTAKFGPIGTPDPKMKPRKVDDPGLAQAGIQMTLNPYTSNQRDPEFEISGNIASIAKIRPVKGDGTVLSEYNFRLRSGYPQKIYLKVPNVQQAEAAIYEITYVTNEKKVTVPFEFKNVAMP